MDLNSLEGSNFEGRVRSCSPGTLGYWETKVETSKGEIIVIGTFRRWKPLTKVKGTVERTQSTPISFLVSHDIKEAVKNKLERKRVK